MFHSLESWCVMSEQESEVLSLYTEPSASSSAFSSDGNSQDTDATSLLGGELSTEPSAEELAADRARDNTGDAEFRAEIAAAVQLWPAQDKNSPEYAHLTDTVAPKAFDVTADVVDILIAANRFKPEGHSNVMALAIRGSTLQQPHEQLKKSAIGINDVRPDHRNFRCTLGFYFRGPRQLTLFSGSTVPCPKYIKNYYNIVHHLPHSSGTSCNMLPTACYVYRVGSHAGGSIKPALRTTDPDHLQSDAVVTVVRTEDDLTFGFGAQDRWDQTTPYDNVHCSYYINYNDSYEAYFSSAGCLTVRGRKDPSDQWAKFQHELNQLGQGKRCDLLLLTGREYALAAMLKASGAHNDPATLQRELVRLRVGSQGDEVRRMQAKLGFSNPTGYFGAGTKKTLTDFQKSNGHPADGIFSPQLDKALRWNVFDTPIM
jgi:Putative peptidoglycan binding domain